MIKILILISFFLFVNCSLKGVDSNHGVAYLDQKNKKLMINKSNKNDIIDFLGPPSTTSLFDNDLWIYIERKSTKSSLFKLGKEKQLKNNVLVLEINTKGLLVNKKLYTLEDYNGIKFNESITNPSDKDSFVYGFISSLRQKIDSPKRNKSK